MNQVNFPMLLLSILVVFMFCLVGVAISLNNYMLIVLFLISGFGFMGIGLAIKRRRSH